LFGLPRYVSCAPVQPAKEPAAKTKIINHPTSHDSDFEIWEDGFVAEATLYLYLYLYLGLVRGLRLRGWGVGCCSGGV